MAGQLTCPNCGQPLKLTRESARFDDMHYPADIHECDDCAHIMVLDFRFDEGEN